MQLTNTNYHLLIAIFDLCNFIGVYVQFRTKFKTVFNLNIQVLFYFEYASIKFYLFLKIEIKF